MIRQTAVLLPELNGREGDGMSPVLTECHQQPLKLKLADSS